MSRPVGTIETDENAAPSDHSHFCIFRGESVPSIKLTRKGYEKLHEELRELVNVRRPQVMADLAQAREYGDISENAEYDTAKRDQGMIEGRIHELEGLLDSVEIIDVGKHVEAASIGARISVENVDFRQRREYVLVSEQEAHLEEMYLSIDSPLGRALLGKQVGEVAEFTAPAGIRRFKILALHGSNGDEE